MPNPATPGTTTPSKTRAETGRTLIVIPTYNEHANIADTVHRVLHTITDAHILIVDDASPDGTGSIATNIATQTKQVTLLSRPRKLGLASAYKEGFQHAITHNYNYVCEFDADGSHTAKDLKTALTKAREGYDLVIGSRRIPGGGAPGWKLTRTLMSRTFGFAAHTLLNTKIKDASSGLRVYRTQTLTHINLKKIRAHGFAFQVELAWLYTRLGYTITETPITFQPRANGTSKMNAAIALEGITIFTRLLLANPNHYLKSSGHTN